MGFYFANFIYSNMLFLCVLISIIGLINMNFSCKGAFGALWRIARVYEGVTSRECQVQCQVLTLGLICHKMEAQNSPTQCISGAKSGFKSGAWYVMKIYVCIEFWTSKTAYVRWQVRSCIRHLTWCGEQQWQFCNFGEF